MFFKNRKNRFDTPRFTNVWIFGQAIARAVHITAKSKAGPTCGSIMPRHFILYPLKQRKA
jgi:hypothetical protein